MKIDWRAIVAWAAAVCFVAGGSVAEARGSGKAKDTEQGMPAVPKARARTGSASRHVRRPKAERRRRSAQKATLRVERRVDTAPSFPRSAADGSRAAPDLDSSAHRLSWGADLPQPDVLRLALRAQACGDRQGLFDQPFLTLIDYSLSSAVPRLWIVDVRTRRILRNALVAHGRNSGEDFAVNFSNDPGSMQSSIGLFRTEDVYLGRHGESLRLTGLEPGINDRAEERKLVMHGAWYVSAAYAAEHGQLGRSWGCPALELGVHRRIIDRIKGGSAVFIYYPDARWLRSSRFLRCDARLAAR